MAHIENALSVMPSNGVETYRASTDAARICGEIVKATVQNIKGKKHVRVEGWQAIAIAHGCTASSRGVEVIEGGVKAIGEIRRMSDGFVIAEAEGFVGDDETMWAARPMYARRAMAQTRAISRACRSAFAHVVVMIDKSLSTTPAEEMQGVMDHGETEDWAAEARKDGLTTETRSAYQVNKVKAAATWTDAALEALRFAALPSDIDTWWEDNAKACDRLEANHPDQHARLKAAAAEMRDALMAKAA